MERKASVQSNVSHIPHLDSTSKFHESGHHLDCKQNVSVQSHSKHPLLMFHPRSVRSAETGDTESRKNIEGWKQKRQKFADLKRRFREDLVNKDTDHASKNGKKSSKRSIASTYTPSDRYKFSSERTSSKDSKTCLETVESGLKLYELSKDSGIKKTKLEKEIDEAIEARDFSLAEKLSDESMARDTAMKLKAVLDASKAKNLDEQGLQSGRRRQKLKWNFERKGRWESKGNM